jgi:PKD repeat protein
MAQLEADFTAFPLSGFSPLSVSFVGNSTGNITYRLWSFGDGQSIENVVSPVHVYQKPGTYNVSLLVRDSSTLEEDIEIKTDYITVREPIINPDKVLIKSSDEGTQKYWKVYLDDDFYIYFETKDYIWKSVYSQISIKKWTFFQFLPHENTMYLGTYEGGWKKIDLIKIVNTKPEPISATQTLIVPNSTFKIDEIQIWKRYFNKKSHFLNSRKKAGMLDDLS